MDGRGDRYKGCEAIARGLARGMTATRHVQIFLEDPLLQSALKREHKFIRLLQDVLEQGGYSTEFLSDTGSSYRDALSLVHMKRPRGRKGLTFRRVYHYPFWQIDQSEQRWVWDVAKARFDPETVNAGTARKFQRFWRKRLYGTQHAPATPDGPVYVPLQGKLTKQRSFQVISPIRMLETVLRYDANRDVVATLHPKEIYDPTELSALEQLAFRHTRLTIGEGGPEHYLPICAYVVTQNSSVAFDGFLFNRPAILCAKIDFHHIAQNLTRRTAEEAFDRVLTDRPDFAKYIHWFWQDQSINAGRGDAAGKIRARLARFGWLD